MHMLIHQNPVLTNKVFEAVSSGMSLQTTAYQIAVAYVTGEGARKLVEALADRIGQKWATIPKTIVTCFDFGHTEPVALEYLQSNGFEVRIANLGANGAIQLIPTATSFHPKVYLAHNEQVVLAVIGSANLSRRALTVNTETIIVAELTALDASAFWNDIVESSVTLTAPLLESYKSVRPKQKKTDAADEPPVPSETHQGQLPLFRTEVENGKLIPGYHSAFWVEAGGLQSGGSGNQLQLPRYGHRFFGFDFTDYDENHHIIGQITLTTSSGSWDCELAWHGGNRMERIYLPTQARSGLTYEHRVILFQRSGDHFELAVVDAGGATAQQWRDESAATGTLYRLGEHSDRTCGFI
jgi:hypothetical protein